MKTKKKKKREYYNVSAAFDIESSSFYENGAKRAIMYCFVFGLNGKVIFGRTWNDLLEICQALKEAYHLDEKTILPVYIHNFSYEFQFMSKWFEWLEVFATDERKPVRGLTSFGIEFRDSYILSGQGLEGTGEDLTKYKISKLKGDLDYTLIRHSNTRLTPKEWHYVENDGLVLMAFVQEEIERNHNNVTNIPLTKTGYIRKYMRNECYHGGQAGHGERRKIKTRDFEGYRKTMSRLTLSVPEYLIAKEAFQGGFTHANNFNVGLIFDNVASEDLSSAYPAALVLERYPMGRGTRLEDLSSDSIRFTLRNYACLMKIALSGVYSRFGGDNFLSYSKCRNVKGHELDNGRILKADYLETSITNLDWEIIKGSYEIESVKVIELWFYPWGYLPKQFIKGVLKLYADKTALKGVEGMEAEYTLKKQLLNSCYGMCVTSIEQPLNTYKDGVWSRELPDIGEMIEKYNKTENRFLFWLWGIFCTAHVRFTIAKAILTELKEDYIYSDTDSVKFKNFKKHERYFEDYNAGILRKIERSSRVNGLDTSLYMPKTKDGKEKPIGVFDFEGIYTRFCTLGAKRYFVEYEEPHKIRKSPEYWSKYSLTISGVNKSAAIPVLEEKAKREGVDIFSFFHIGFLFDEEAAGKQVHTYCDYEIEGEVIDYLGEKGHYKELSFIHLEPTTYKLTTTEEFYQNLIMDKLGRIKRRETIKI